MGALETTAQSLAKLLYQTANAGTVNAEMLRDAEKKGFNNKSAGYDSLIDSHNAALDSISDANAYVNQYVYTGPKDNTDAFVTVTIDGHSVNFDKNMLKTCSPTEVDKYSTGIVDNTVATASSYQAVTGQNPANSVEIVSYQKQSGMETVRGDFSTLFNATKNNMVGFNGTGPVVLDGADVTVDTHTPAGQTSQDDVESETLNATKRILGDGAIDGKKDGKLSKAEALAYFDKNKDGHITDKELGGLNGLVGDTTTIGQGEHEHEVTTLGGVRVEEQDTLDKQNFVKDYQQLKASGNPLDQKKAAQLDQFFAWASKASDADKQGFADSVAIAQALKLKSGKDSGAFAAENDPEWQAVTNMTPEQRAEALKEAKAIQSLQGSSSSIGYTGEGMQTQAELEANSERRKVDHSGMGNSSSGTSPSVLAGNSHSGMGNSSSGTSPSVLAGNSHSGMGNSSSGTSPSVLAGNSHSGMGNSSSGTSPSVLAGNSHSGMGNSSSGTSPSVLAGNSHSGMGNSSSGTSPSVLAGNSHSGMATASQSSLAGNTHSGMASNSASPASLAGNTHAGLAAASPSPSSLAGNSHSGMASPATPVSSGDHSGMNPDFKASLVSDLNPTGSIQKDKDLKAFFAAASANQQTNPDFKASLVSDLNPTGSIQKDKDLKAFFAGVSANKTTTTANHSGMGGAPAASAASVASNSHSGMMVSPPTFPPPETPAMRPIKGAF